MMSEEKEEMSNFKARPLKKHILERPDFVPEMERKKSTSFEEFKLSKSNDHQVRARKILDEYEREINAMKNFKARPMNAKILENPDFRPQKIE